MSFVAKFVAKKILGESVQNKFGTEDPYFEEVPASRLDGKAKGKKAKRRKKALPPGISEHDGLVLTKVKRRAYRLDMALFSFLGIRFGWGSALGIIPVAGDALDAFMAMMVLKTCMQVEGGLPAAVKVQMLFNIAFDFVIGLVPFVGDIIDAGFKANSRNALLLEKHLREKGKKQLQQSGLPIPAVDPSSPAEFDKDEREESHRHSTHVPSRQGSRNTRPHAAGEQHAPSAPEQARVNEGRSFLGRNKTRPTDVEMGQVNPSRASSKRQSNGRH